MHIFRPWLLSFVLTIFFFPLSAKSQLVNSVSPDGKPMPGHMDVGQLSEENQRAFFSSVFTNVPLLRSGPYMTIKGDEKDVAAWKGHDPEIGAEISRAVIRFRPLQEENADDLTASRTFDLVIDFKPQEIVIRHSLVSWKKQKEGDRFTPGVDPQWKGYIKGDFDSQMVVVVPQMIIAPGAPRSVFLCPRKPTSIFPKGGKKIRVLMDSQYRVAFGLFASQAQAKGSIPKSLGGGEAYASILTSTSIARSTEFERRASGPEASVDLNYAMLGHEQVLHKEDEEGSVVGAIQSKVVLTSAAGLKRESTVRDTVWVKAVRMPKDKAWSTQLSETTWMPVAPGVCYIVFKEKTVTDEYSRVQPAQAATESTGGTAQAASSSTGAQKP